jgi:hypothetical protein
VLAVIATAVHTEPLPQPKPPGPGGSCPHGYTSSGKLLRPVSACAGRNSETAERDLSLGLDFVRLVLPAQRQAVICRSWSAFADA